MHIAIVGTGRVGKTLAYKLMHEPYLEELSLADTVPNLTKALAEELRHVMAGNSVPIKINAYEHSAEIKNADLIIISAGRPRTPEMKDRRDLVNANAGVMKVLAEEMRDNNKHCTYIVITNPVDAMATLFAEYSHGERVIGTGTSLDTLRFRAELAKNLNVPINQITGLVAGEHGESAIFLWSTVEVNHEPLETYCEREHVTVDRQKIELAVKKVSKMIIQELGGTTFGPATAFTKLVSAIALDKEELTCAALPYSFEQGKSVYISLPILMGKVPHAVTVSTLADSEQQEINTVAKSIWHTYQDALQSVK